MLSGGVRLFQTVRYLRPVQFFGRMNAECFLEHTGVETLKNIADRNPHTTFTRDNP